MLKILTAVFMLTSYSNFAHANKDKENILKLGENYFRSSPVLPKGVRAVGKKVYTSFLVLSTITHMNLPDGKMYVKDKLLKKIKVSESKTAHTEGCINGICVGDEIITMTLKEGKILGYWDDGTLLVRDSSDLIPYFQSDIARTEGCSSQYCVGDFVFNGKGETGVVNGLFGNGDLLVSQTSNGRYKKYKEIEIFLNFPICKKIPLKRKGLCHGH